jgi:hypothetical protein
MRGEEELEEATRLWDGKQSHGPGLLLQLARDPCARIRLCKGVFGGASNDNAPAEIWRQQPPSEIACRTPTIELVMASSHAKLVPA